MSKMKNIVYIFLISMLPIIELRGAIPVGAGLGVDFFSNFTAAVIGNLVPVPFILLFIPKILEFLSRFKPFRPIVSWLWRKAERYSGKIIQGENSSGVSDAESKKARLYLSGAFVGLMTFVLLPIPGTGAWTGSLVAALFKLPFWRSLLAVTLGVIGCAVIMSLASYGVVGFLSFLAA